MLAGSSMGNEGGVTQLRSDSDRQMRQIADWLPQLVYSCRADGACDYVSPRWFEYTGLSIEKGLGYAWIDQVHPDDREGLLAAWRVATEKGIEHRAEFRLRRRDGAYRWFETRAVRVEDDDGRFVRWFGSNTDIHEHREVRDALRDKEQQLADVVSSAPGVLCTIEVVSFGSDVVIRMPFASPDLVNLVGIAPERVAADAAPLFDIMHPDDRDHVRLSFDPRYMTWSPWRAEFRIAHPTRGEIWIEGDAAPRRLPDGSLRWHGILRDITLRKQAEAALARWQERFTTAFHNGPAASVISRVNDRRLVEMNDRFLELIGCERGEVLGKTLAEAGIDTAEDAAVRLAILARHATPDGSARDVEMPFPTKGGDRKTVLCSVERIELESEGPCLLSSLVDITHRKQLERRLDTQHEVSRVLAESTSLATAGNDIVRALCDAEGWELGVLWLVDPMAGVLRAATVFCRETSAAVQALDQATRALVLGKDEGLAGRVWASSRPIVLQALDGSHEREAAARLAGYLGAVAFPVLHRDEVVGVVDVLARHVHPEDAQLLDLFDAIGRQIGLFVERQRAQSALRKSQDQLQSVIESMGEGLVVSDLAGKILHFNPAAVAMHGFTRAEDWRRHLAEFTAYFEFRTVDTVEVLPFKDWPLARVLRGERLRQLELRILRIDISWSRVFSYGGELVVQPDGSTIAVLTVSDVTERTESAAELKLLLGELETRVAARTSELKAANRELEAFGYSVSHDLRSPLRAMNGYAQMLLEDFGGVLPVEGQRMLGIIREAGSRMGELIDDLLDLSRVSRKERQLRRVEMDDLVRGVLDDLSMRPSDTLELRIGELPAADVDPVLMRQVWTNLLSNALKYSRGRQPAVVEVGFEAQADGPVYFVRDNGAGFDMRYVHKLFGVFQRLHRPDEFEGTGVGLAIVQRIVQRHGGRVWAKAELGRGATFYFTVQTGEEPR